MVQYALHTEQAHYRLATDYWGFGHHFVDLKIYFLKIISIANRFYNISLFTDCTVIFASSKNIEIELVIFNKKKYQCDTFS